MSRYYFDIQNGGQFVADENGQDLAGPDAARRAASGLLVKLARHRAPDEDHRMITANVRDESGRVAFTSKLTLDYGWLG